MRCHTYLLLVLAASGCAGAPVRRDNFLNAERRSIAELANEIAFVPDPDDLADEAVVGVAATLAVRTCFPDDKAFAAVWHRWVSVKQTGDMAIVSLQKQRRVNRSGSRWRIVHDAHPCLDRMAVLLPPGTRFGGALNGLVSLMRWGRTPVSTDAVKRQLLVEMQVVQALRARCFANQQADGDVLLAWSASSVRVLDIRNGNSYAGNACSERFELAYPIDVAGRAVTPQPGASYTEMSFSHAAYPIAQTRAAWGVED